MAANDVAVTHDGCARGYDSGFHPNQTLHHLENGPWAVGAANGAVVKGFPRMLEQAVVRGATAGSREQIPVVARGGDKRQDFSRGRLDGHDGPALACHQRFRVGLQVRFECERDVFARDGQRVVFGKGASNVVSDVHEVLSHSGLATKDGLVLSFHARLADVVAQAVVVVAIHVLPIDFAKFPDDLACQSKYVLPHGLGSDG